MHQSRELLCLLFLYGLFVGFTLFSKSPTTTNDQSHLPVRFHMALVPQNEALLEEYVLSISNPQSPIYGSYMSRAQIDQLTQTPLSARRQVEKWLISNAIYDCTWYADAVTCQAPASKVECLFNITFDEVFSVNSKIHLSTTDIYQLPSHLQSIIQFVEGLTFPYVRLAIKNPKIFSDQDTNKADTGLVTREVMQRLYNFPAGNLNPKLTSVGAMEYEGQDGFSQKDLVNSELANAVPSNPVGKNQTIGHPSFPDTESQLDIQMIGQLAANAELWYEVAPTWMYSWAVDFYNRERIPYIVSLSWGWSETGQCTIIQCLNETSQEYVNRANFEFMKLAARGVTILVSSGDAGSPGRTNENCLNTDSSNAINPVFPGSSKWVTSVGATFIVKSSDQESTAKTPVCNEIQCATGTQEQMVDRLNLYWTSGAGFDRWQKTPSWQAKEVSAYLKSGVQFPPQDRWNRHGRAYPDVSAVGHNCAVRNGAMWNPVDGTSCSAPVFAGLLAVVNDHQMKNGRPRLGFVNPLLYQMARDRPKTFHDITQGNSSCTEYSCCGPDFGFVATEGWDVVSGLGTPNIGEMINYLDAQNWEEMQAIHQTQ